MGTASKHNYMPILIVFMALLLTMPVHAAGKTPFYAKVKKTKLLVNEQTSIATRGSNVTYTFKSSKPKVATVSKDGTITAQKKGTTTIKIKGTWKKKGKRYSKTIKVKIRVYSCRFNLKSFTMKQGSTSKKLKITGETLKRKISWTSSNPSVAVVSQKGNITGIRSGMTTICARVGNSVTLSCNVKVSSQSIGSNSCTMLVNGTHTYGALDLKHELAKKMNIGSKPVYYTVADPALGHMNGNIYYADAAGANTVTVYCGYNTAKFYIKQTLWCAHRGYLDIRPENTIDAFEAAVFAGAGIIETDLHVTSDGYLVLHHDSTVTRMTGKSAKIKNMTFEEVRALTITRGNGAASCKNRQIPTLDEYLSICKRYHIIADIELKSLGTARQQEESARKIYKSLQDHGMLKQAFITSFYPNLLKIFRDTTGPTVPVGILASAAPARIDEFNSFGLANAATSQTTVFGSFKTSNYSPLVGQKGRGPKNYK